MVHELNIGGESRPVLFGNLAFRKMKMEAGITLAQVGEAMTGGDVTILPDILYFGLQAGKVAQKNKSKEVFSVEDVAVWMDIEPGIPATILPWLLSAIENMSGQSKSDTTGEGDETPKKMEATTSIGPK